MFSCKFAAYFQNTWRLLLLYACYIVNPPGYKTSKWVDEEYNCLFEGKAKQNQKKFYEEVRIRTNRKQLFEVSFKRKFYTNIIYNYEK